MSLNPAFAAKLDSLIETAIDDGRRRCHTDGRKAEIIAAVEDHEKEIARMVQTNILMKLAEGQTLKGVYAKVYRTVGEMTFEELLRPR